MKACNVFKRFVYFGAGIILTLMVVNSGTRAATWRVDSLRGRISTDSTTIMYLMTNPDSTTIYVFTQTVASISSDRTILAIFDSSVHFQIDTAHDSISYNIPNDGKGYWFIPFKHQYSSEHPWPLSFSTNGGNGHHICQCSGEDDHGSCVLKFIVIDWMGIIIPYCEDEACGGGCAFGSSIPRVGGPFEYNNSGLIISASNVFYNGVHFP